MDWLAAMIGWTHPKVQLYTGEQRKYSQEKIYINSKSAFNNCWLIDRYDWISFMHTKMLLILSVPPKNRLIINYGVCISIRGEGNRGRVFYQQGYLVKFVFIRDVSASWPIFTAQFCFSHTALCPGLATSFIIFFFNFYSCINWLP